MILEETEYEMLVETPWDSLTGTEDKVFHGRLMGTFGGIGLFNDGILASEIHLGTFGELPCEEAGWVKPWKPEDEMEFEDKLCRYVPHGGEVVLGKTRPDRKKVLDTLRRMHISYLNSTHDEKMLGYWKEIKCGHRGAYKKLSLFDYVGMHLGYRFVVKDVDFSGRRENRLDIMIMNVGMANLYEEADCYLVLKKGEEKRRILLEEDVRLWDSGEIICVSCILYLKDLEGLESRWGFGECQVYLGMKRKKDGHIIRFANRGAGEEILLGILN
jgi:hypothetical protein